MFYNARLYLLACVVIDNASKTEGLSFLYHTSLEGTWICRRDIAGKERYNRRSLDFLVLPPWEKNRNVCAVTTVDP